MNVDPLASLASSVHAGQRVFAFLLGSGVSKGAGVPTSWEVVECLAGRLARLEGEDVGGDPIGWYRRRFGGDPDYSVLVEGLAPSPVDRRNLLRKYFEPSDEERAEGLKLPATAHRAIAGLVAKGFVSVIVTTNFDRLIEQALSDAGVQPAVIASSAVAKGAMPLAHSKATVIKVHGDYLSPDLRNTIEELETYDPAMNRLLDEVFDQYGLVVCGWSAKWDKALRNALESATSRRFSCYWLHRGPLEEEAERLIAHRGAIRVGIEDADTALGTLAAKVEALAEAADQRPQTTDLAVAHTGWATDEHPNPSNAIRLDFHVEPQFVHRILAGQALGIDASLSLDRLADRITDELYRREVVDLRLAAIKGELGSVLSQVVRLRSAMYFKYVGTGPSERCRFHYNVTVDEGQKLSVKGEFDPHRFEANSPRTNLSGQRNVYVAGVAAAVDEEQLEVTIRPLLIGDPYYVPYGGKRSDLFNPDRSELHYSDVDQFQLATGDLRTLVTNDEAARLFAMPEEDVKKAFARILGVKRVPKDWGGEQSDLIAEFTTNGVPCRAAFALTGQGGRSKPWVLHPSTMRKNGDQGMKLFTEVTNVMVVQHCGPIAESVRHMMEALSVRHKKRYMIMDGDATVRVLKRANLLN